MSETNNGEKDKKCNRAAGFTLMEVMIVIVIIAILLGAGLPGYQESLRKGRRSEAKAGLMEVANRQEQYMLDRSTYTTDLTRLGYTSPLITDEGHYGIVVEQCDGGSIENCYKLTASPLNSSPQIKDTKCGKFVLNSRGVREVSGSLAADQCW